MSWLDFSINERRTMMQNASNLPDYAIEKDWWVTMVLKALFRTSCANKLEFKGGTSLSKCWNLINRFSEDIDLAIHYSFFTEKIENNNQLKNLRKNSHKYILNTLSDELHRELKNLGLYGYEVSPQIFDEDGTALSSDADPTILYVKYDSISRRKSSYVPPQVKVEISCLSMDEPIENKRISSIISQKYPDEDKGTECLIPTVLPTRTFLEKVFLLNEEFQRETPRSHRMSRHLFDLATLMKTPFGKDAMQDKELYHKIVEHRRTFYHVSYANYDKNYPPYINIIPPANCMAQWRDDYTELQSNFIHGASPSFDQLIISIRELENRFHQIDFE